MDGFNHRKYLKKPAPKRAFGAKDFKTSSPKTKKLHDLLAFKVQKQPKKYDSVKRQNFIPKQIEVQQPPPATDFRVEI